LKQVGVPLECEGILEFPPMKIGGPIEASATGGTVEHAVHFHR